MQKIINRLKKMGLSATQIIFNLVTSGLICCTTVSGHSMMPTVHDGDRLLYNPFFKNVERGDIVVISHGGDMLIKRVIAIGGDHLTISTYGSVAINGIWQNETYINSQTSSESIDIIIPNGELWIMGDNRGHSTDSRHFGMVELGDVLGVVILKKHKDLED